MSLIAAKNKLESDIEDALYEGFMSTFLVGAGDEGKNMANRFAKKSAPKIADALLEFVTKAEIKGTITGVVTATCAVGPVSGTTIDTVVGNELKII